MVVRVRLKPHETVAQAMRRLETVIRKEGHRTFKWYGPMGWMLVTTDHYQKPSYVRRMKKASQKARARMRP